ncbi:dynein light chain tctex-type [Anaeramoeba flamelloides]|uniref:Dynein light chain tctex-type n=2 Tax=Anaeramoeba flamelloides TaxID=1746091 RepID=A0AAV8ADT9_9EUKA|nr:dynein light chain tctex-type [Anaeramoeba flamelloides]
MTTERFPFMDKVEEIKDIIKECSNEILQKKKYQHAMVNRWTTVIIDKILGELNQKKYKFKYVVTSMIIQKGNTGMHSSTSCYWDNSLDGNCSYRWENDNMYCITSVYGLTY